MSSGSQPEKILDIRPFLGRSQATLLNGGSPSGEFVDLIDDSPGQPQETAGKRAPRVTMTWRIFFWMLLTGTSLGVVATPLVYLVVPGMTLGNGPAVGFVIVASCVITAYVNYRVIRVLAARLLARVTEQTVEMFSLPEPALHAPLQATEVDRLEEALLKLMTELKHQVDSQKRLERSDLVSTITALATALEARDPYTKNHSRCVARMSVRLARRMGLPRPALYEIHLAGLLHDIGKIGVPDHILLKPSRLTEDEMRIVQAHVEWSYNILSSIRALREVGIIARHHHERYDGRGYPDRLAGERIPLGARVMGVVDLFMAMTEDRPYRRALPVEAAVAEIRRVSGTQLDPACVEEFLALLVEDGIIGQERESGSKRASAN